MSSVPWWWWHLVNSVTIVIIGLKFIFRSSLLCVLTLNSAITGPESQQILKVWFVVDQSWHLCLEWIGHHIKAAMNR